jgi:hypothetical protein
MFPHRKIIKSVQLKDSKSSSKKIISVGEYFFLENTYFLNDLDRFYTNF